MTNTLSTTNQTVLAAPLVHIFASGIQRNISLEELSDIGNASPDLDILRAVAVFLNLPTSTMLDKFVLSRDPETGNITIRPPAVFG